RGFGQNVGHVAGIPPVVVVIASGLAPGRCTRNTLTGIDRIDRLVVRLSGWHRNRVRNVVIDVTAVAYAAATFVVVVIAVVGEQIDGCSGAHSKAVLGHAGHVRLRGVRIRRGRGAVGLGRWEIGDRRVVINAIVGGIDHGVVVAVVFQVIPVGHEVPA